MTVKGELTRVKNGMRHKGPTRRTSAGRFGSLLEGSVALGVIGKGVAGHATDPGLL